MTSRLNYRQGRARANNAVITLDTAGRFSVFATCATDLVVDVSGYFQ